MWGVTSLLASDRSDSTSSAFVAAHSGSTVVRINMATRANLVRIIATLQ
jgi:hypothetical protein